MKNDYEIYLETCKKLARTIRIKSTRTIDQINTYLVVLYGEDAVDYSDPYSWQYYKHCAGEYHKFDTRMSVVSWDTGEVLDFSKANLEIHTKTKKAFQFGTTQYKELVKLYPNQESLILGILYPVDIQVAIDADNGQILSYPAELVEANEYSLIQNLQEWINGFYDRWFVPDFSNHHELYLAAHLCVMFSKMYLKILNLRLRACKTYEAHSFHIKQYLVSRGISGEIFQYLSKKQQLFLYRNIDYIVRNAGKKETFTWLIEKILTDRHLPLSSYYIRHQETDQLDDLVPTAMFKHKSLNSVYETAASDYLTKKAILALELSDAPGNENYVLKNEERINTLLDNSLSNVVQTKILESSVVDYEDTGQFSLQNTLMLYWGYLSHKGYYTNLVHIENQVTGEFYTMTAKEAFILYLYCYCKSLRIELEDIPSVVFEHVFRSPVPSVEDMMSVVDSKYVDKEIFVYARSLVPEYRLYSSTSDFAADCVKFSNAAKSHQKLMALPEHMYSRALTQAGILRLVQDVPVDLAAPNTKYANWIESRSINFSNFSAVDYKIFYQAIIADATGIDFAKESTLAGLHTAMLSLLKTLSSYSVQFIKQFSGSDLISMNFIMTRAGDAESLMHDKDSFPIGRVDLMDAKSIQHEKGFIDIAPAELDTGIIAKQNDKGTLDISLTISGTKQPLQNTGFLRINPIVNSMPVFTPVS